MIRGTNNVSSTASKALASKLESAIVTNAQQIGLSQIIQKGFNSQTELINTGGISFQGNNIIVKPNDDNGWRIASPNTVKNVESPSGNANSESASIFGNQSTIYKPNQVKDSFSDDNKSSSRSIQGLPFQVGLDDFSNEIERDTESSNFSDNHSLLSTERSGNSPHFKLANKDSEEILPAIVNQHRGASTIEKDETISKLSRELDVIKMKLQQEREDHGKIVQQYIKDQVTVNIFISI